jgi:adenylate kinase family enzyme
VQDFPVFTHVSTGDLLRQHVREQTKLGQEAATYMRAGHLVPDGLMISLVLDHATTTLEQGQSLLLDGFPRSLQQAVALEEVVHLEHVINLNVPTQTIVERIADRYV